MNRPSLIELEAMSKQCIANIIMIRPVKFRMNEQTAVNNFYQQSAKGMTPQEISQMAIKEFDDLVDKLKAHGVNVMVIQDQEEPSTPDSIFPNNWVSFHNDGRISLYPMFAKNRRQERRVDLMNELESAGFSNSEIVDFTHYEEENKFLEGTGSLVLDRDNKIAYAANSERTHPELIEVFCKEFGYNSVSFHAMQNVEGERAPIYHTNVMMCIGKNIAMVGLECIDDLEEREVLRKAILDSGKELLELTESQINQFAGNMLELESKEGEPLIVMSDRAYSSLESYQIEVLEKHGKIIKSKLDLIEQLGGGSARCMIAENFLLKH